VTDHSLTKSARLRASRLPAFTLALLIGAFASVGTAQAQSAVDEGRCRMKTLSRYIGLEVLGYILLIFSALVMLFAFFDLIHELGDVGKAGYTVSSAFLFVAVVP
jgi:uncharacterized protein HemY